MKPNVDSKEAEKFAQLANEWWDFKGPFRVLHQMNPIRLHFMEERLSFPGKKFLDVGCGGGILSEGLAKKGAQVTGIDIGEDVLSVARKHAEDSDLAISYALKTIEELAMDAPGSFDGVACCELLEHVPNPRSIVEACAQVVAPGGHVFFSTVNRTLKAYVMAVLGAEYLLHLLPIGTHDFERFVRPSELARWARESGLTVKTLQGISFNPFTQTFGMSQSLSINYLLHAVCS
ncbi:MAG: bifunctional 2-polyprenyl-6-hydroxyphenol methylase/3-demethylubiquinol 3-O-methyltransferase UbiG [Gammaproteobacteria bacterium]|nr:bifunctional 2-polyprenyl-6-hydroxyphenol methylase/3-demethylubiquinol 3-O-methyltransferase UbiG [Gammaproteobacteria bacterium]